MLFLAARLPPLLPGVTGEDGQPGQEPLGSPEPTALSDHVPGAKHRAVQALEHVLRAAPSSAASRGAGNGYAASPTRRAGHRPASGPWAGPALRPPGS